MSEIVYNSNNVNDGIERRKRKSSENDGNASSNDTKRPRLRFFVRLESESSLDSQDDTDTAESVYSIQGRETDIVRDTSDTDSSFIDSDIESADILTLEYEVESLSSHSDDFPDYSSSGTEDLNIQAATEGAIAAVLLDTSVDAWETDEDTSDGSTSLDAFDWGDIRTDFRTCLQCKSRNDNPSYRYCDKCFQVRKTCFPPRPKPTRKRKLAHDDESEGPARQKVKLDTLKDCLDKLRSKEHGDGAGALAEASTAKLPEMKFEDIVVPQAATLISNSTVSSGSKAEEEEDGVTMHREEQEQQKESSSEAEVAISSSSEGSNSSSNRLCIICETMPTDSVFVHSNSGHMSCCYKCAMKTWKMHKRCPMCNGKVSKVIKLVMS